MIVTGKNRRSCSSNVLHPPSNSETPGNKDVIIKVCENFQQCFPSHGVI